MRRGLEKGALKRRNQVDHWPGSGGLAGICVTSDRYESWCPQFSPDGKWLYFLSDRHFHTTQPSPWGLRAPEPHFDKQTKLYAVFLPEMKTGKSGEIDVTQARSPFDEETELDTQKKRREARAKEAGEDGGGDKAADDGGVCVGVHAAGLQDRAIELPLPAGRYSSLVVTKNTLFFISHTAPEVKNELKPGYSERSFTECTGRAMAMRVSRKRTGSNSSEAYEFAPGMACTRIELTAGAAKIMLQDNNGKLHVALHHSA
jgi:hypothetical protein